MPTLVTVVLAFWLLLILVRQLGHVGWRWSRELAGAIQRHDVFHLIPSFCFFAPHPPWFEYELLYRDLLEDGGEGSWRALDLYANRWHRAVWNPEKRRYQVAFRMCTALIERVHARLNGRDAPGELFVSAAYVAIANRIAGAPHAVTAVSTQFLIAVSPGFDSGKEPAIAFVSPPFRL